MSADDLLKRALEIPEADRPAFLEQACGGDAALRDHVERLLVASVQGGGVEGPSVQSVATRAATWNPQPPRSTEEFAPRSGPGTVIAERYTLVEKIGEGGMGEVWVAKQSEPIKRKVALKLIKAGMDSRAVLARFDQERQALAVMDHPNIAKVLDGGLTGDRHPYFVMELVHGLPVTKFCDEAKLPVRERLQLFISICQGVQHAHQKGIIHRDLKPANILVSLIDGKPVPKVIDFGVAKAVTGRLTDDSLSTQIGAVVGTLEYMAPEQAGLTAHDIDTRADLYSLGIILYELLTGMRPFDRRRLRQGALEEMIRVIREEEPPSLASRLSTDESLPSAAAVRQLEPKRLLAMIKGELDWIVMKCLEKDRNRRYETPISLARDIERYLADEPVEARPASATYRLQKFYRRHRGPVLAVCLLLLVLVGGIIGTTWGLIVADYQRGIAEAKEKEAAQAKDDAEARARAEERAKNQAQAETARAEAEKARADAQAEEVRHALYAARQQVAMNAWRENRADVLQEMVLRQQPAPGEADLRGFEWAFLDRLARAPGQRWQTRGPMINGVAISPDSRTAVTVGFDGKATAWDVATGKKLWDTGAAFRWSVNAAAFSPDGKTIALAGHLGQLQLWNADGTQRARLDGHRAQVFGVAFSPDGTTLSSASADVTIRLWDVATAAPAGVLSQGPEPMQGGAKGLLVVPQTDPTGSVGHTNMVWQTAWSPDGKRLASCSTDGTIKIWAVPERRLLRTLTGHDGIVIAVAWLPGGKQVVGVSRSDFGNSGEAKIWNAETGRAEATFRAPTSGFHAVAVTPDGLHIVTAGQDRSVRVWRRDGRLIAEHRGFRDEVIGLAIGGGGRWAIAGSRAGEVVAFQLDSAPGRQSIPASDGARVAVTTDGRLAVFSRGLVHWHDSASLAELSKWPAAKAAEPPGPSKGLTEVAAFALRPDGESAHGAHSYTGPGTVVWRDAAGKVRHLLAGHSQPIAAVAFLSDDRLASADEGGMVRIWNGADGKEIANVQAWDGPVHFLTATPEGRLWVGGVPGAPGSKPGQWNRPTGTDGRLTRIEDGKITWETKLERIPLAADLSPDGRTLAVGCSDGALLWLDAAAGNERHRRAYPTGALVSLRFSPKERRLAAGGIDGHVRLLDAESGEELLVLEGKGALPPASLAFFPDGLRLAAAATAKMTSGTLVVWDGRPASSPPALRPPDLAWHKTQLATADESKRIVFGAPFKDQFAMRYHLERLAVLEPDELNWPRTLLAMDQQAGDFRSAATRLQGIVGHWPNEAPMWYDLGNARRELEDVAGAEVAFRQCVALDPKMPEAHCNLGLLLGRDGRLADAIASLERGHELGMAQQKAGKKWTYPSAAWLARHRRLADVATQFGKHTDFTDVPAADRGDLIEVLMLTKRPLAAIGLADAKPEKSPGPTVTGAALRCAEGIGDAAKLSATERSAWRNKALAWLRFDLESFRALDATLRSRNCTGMRSHPYLTIAQGDRTASWPAAEREAWSAFWAEIEAGATGIQR